MKRTILALVAATALSPLGPLPAPAWHAFQAEHAPPPAVPGGRPVVVSVAVVTSCVIAYCSWVEMDVYFVKPDGTIGIAWVEGPYEKPAQTLEAKIPGADVQAPVLTYWIEARQQSCIGDCHYEVVNLPRMGDRYTVPVDNRRAGGRAEGLVVAPSGRAPQS